MSTDRQSPSPESAPDTHTAGLPVTKFRPQKTNLFIAGFLLILAVVAMGYSMWFAPLLLVPIVFVVWMMRVRTTVSDRGITAVYLLRGRRSLPWERFRGVLFDKAGHAHAVGRSAGADEGADDVKFALPAISFNSLPELSAATGGRIPDPVTPARLAEDEKVQVFDKDGNLVLREAEPASGTGDAADATDAASPADRATDERRPIDGHESDRRPGGRVADGDDDGASPGIRGLR